MPQVRFRESIAANATEDINLAPLDRLPSTGGRVTLYAATTADGNMRASLLLGTDLVLDRGFVNVASAAGIVRNPEDLLAQGVGAPGDPVTLRMENTTGAAVIVQGLVSFEF